MTPWDALRDVKLDDKTGMDLSHVSDFSRYLATYFVVPFGRASSYRYGLHRVMARRFPIAARLIRDGSRFTIKP